MRVPAASLFLFPISTWATAAMPADDGIRLAQPAAQATQETSSAAVSSADDLSGLRLEEVTVTAERRAESSQKVPISMSVFSRDFIKEHIVSVFDVASFTPNFDIMSNNGFGQSSTSSIRGIGTGEQSAPQDATSILTYYDGIPIGSQFGAVTPQWDLERIEVQRGPQGTLYGRNAVAGAIQFASAAPSEDLHGYVEVEGGDYDLRRVEGAVSGPITENIKGRLSALGYERGGNVRNTFLDVEQGEQEWWGVRGILDWQLTDHLDARLKAQYFDGDVDVLFFNAASSDLLAPGTLAWMQATGTDPDLPRRSNFKEIQSPLADPYDKFDMTLVELDFNYDFGPVGLTAVFGYVDGNESLVDSTLNFAAAAGVQAAENTSEQWTGEVRLTSQSDGPFEWIAGAFYQRNDDAQFKGFSLDYSGVFRDADGDGLTRYNADSPADLLDGLIPIYPASNVVLNTSIDGTQQDLDTYAVFLHTKYRWTERLTTTQAVRYTKEEKDAQLGFISIFEVPVSAGVIPGTLDQLDDILAFARLTDDEQRQQALAILSDDDVLDADGRVVLPQARRSWEEVTWRFAADYQVSDTVLFYSSVSTGFKGGAFSLDPGPDGGPLSVDPEKSLVFEVGTKSQWLDRRLQLNASAFFNNHENLQSSQLEFRATGSAVSTLSNLPEVQLYGGEVEIQAIPTEHLLISANIGALRTEITEVNAGNESLLGKELPNAPDINFSGLVRYEVVTGIGAFSPQVSWRYRGETWSSKDNSDTTGQLGNFWTADVRVGYASANNNLYGSLYVRNVFDEVNPIFNVLADAQLIGTSLSKINERRIWGVTLGYRF